MNIEIHDREDTTAELDTICRGKPDQFYILRIVEANPGRPASTTTIYLNPKLAAQIRAALDEAYPVAGGADPTPTHPERDAAPTLDVCDVLAADRAMDDAITAADEEALAAIRPPGISRCAATADTMDALAAKAHAPYSASTPSLPTPNVSEWQPSKPSLDELRVKHMAQTMEFVASKLGL